MEILESLSFIIVLLVILVKSAQLIEDAFVFLARKIKVNEFFIGMVILGTVTSLPELAIAINASRDPHTRSISVGNLLGGNIILLTVIMGISVIKFGSLKFKGRFKERDVLIALSILLLGVVLILDKKLGVFDGILLVLGYVAYIIYISQKFHEKRAIKQTAVVRVTHIYGKLGKAVIGILLLILSSSLVVTASESLAKDLGVKESLIGIFLLAIGTNLPEFTILYTVKKKSEAKLAEGNFLGSACVNAGILGILAISAGGFEILYFTNLIPVITITFLAILMFGIFSWTGREITKKEAIILIFLYFSLIISESFFLIAGV